MRARRPGRYLAPVALIAVLVAVIVVIRSGGGGHHASTSTITTRQLPASRPARPKRTFYVVKASDTLSGISVKTGVPIATLEALNPSIDLSALQIGQRIRLRR